MKTTTAMRRAGAGLLLTLGLIASAALGNGVAPYSASYAYDANNRVTQVTYSDGRQVSYTYDDTGNVTAVTTRNVAVPLVLVESRLPGAVGAAVDDYAIQVQSSSPVISYAAAKLPKGLKLNAGTVANADGKPGGTIYGTPLVGGRFTVMLTAKSAAGVSAPTPLIIDIANAFTRVEDGFSLTGGFSGAIAPSAVAGGALGGWLTLKTTATGSFSGSLQLGGLKYAFNGSFDGITGVAPSIPIPRSAPLGPLTLDLTLILAGPARGQVLVSLGDGATSEAATLHREVWSKTLLPLAFSGLKQTRYNTALLADPAHAGDDAYPQGSGYAAVTVSIKGVAALAGKLADGTVITQSRVLWPDGQLPLFAPLYGNRGCLQGGLTIGLGTVDGDASDNPVTGALAWSRPVSTKAGDPLFAAGFDTDLEVAGGAYTPPAKGARVLDLGSAAGSVAIPFEFDEGGLAGPISGTVALSTTNAVTAITPNNHAITLKFTAASGLVSGGFTVGGAKAKLEALILPATDSLPSQAFGYFLLPGPPTLAGSVFISPPG